MAFTVIQEPTHGWRVKKLKPRTVKALPVWTPGSHNCAAAKAGGCYCSGQCMQQPGSVLGALARAGFTYTSNPIARHNAALAETDNLRIG